MSTKLETSFLLAGSNYVTHDYCHHCILTVVAIISSSGYHISHTLYWFLRENFFLLCVTSLTAFAPLPLGQYFLEYSLCYSWSLNITKVLGTVKLLKSHVTLCSYHLSSLSPLYEKCGGTESV